MHKTMKSHVRFSHYLLGPSNILPSVSLHKQKDT
jgi:hypothetical protein